MNEEKRSDKAKFMKAGYTKENINQEEKRRLEAKCLECQEIFQECNDDGKLFDYSRCLRCNTGRVLHEMDTPGWFADYVKSGL